MGFSIMEITQATSKQIVYISSVYKAVVQDFFVYYQRTSVKYILCTLVLHVPSVIVYKNPDPSTNSRTLYNIGFGSRYEYLKQRSPETLNHKFTRHQTNQSLNLGNQTANMSLVQLSQTSFAAIWALVSLSSICTASVLPSRKLSQRYFCAQSEHNQNQETYDGLKIIELQLQV